MALPRFLLLAFIKAVSRIFYRFEVEWVGRRPACPFHDARVGLLLNHTSLFEPLFIGTMPLSWLWEVAKRGLLPGADSTLNRPLVGRLFKFMVPNAVSVTRNRDKTWREFVSQVGEDTIVLMSPEGRMKRRDGLDKHGKPMSMRGGIVDVLERKHHGNLLLLYSAGLHHVQCPGEGFPRLFQTIRLRYEEIPLERYKKSLHHGGEHFRANVMADLERRRDEHCPWTRELSETARS